MDEILCPIYQHAEEILDQIAIETPERSLTYSELNAAIANHVNTLKGLSIPPKAHVAFVATTSLASILLLFSLFRLKATACPLSFRTPAEQIPTLMERCSASHLLRADDLPLLTTPVPSDPPTYTLDQLATILMTSGSSGTPKAACHTIHNHVANAQGALTPLQCTAATRWLLSLPLFHVGGLAILFRCFIAGGTVVISDQPLCDALEHNQITHASLVPTQLFRLLQEPQEQIAALAQSMRCLLIGGAPLSASLAQKAHPLPLFATYGMTEMSSMVTLAQPQEIRNNLHMGKPLPYRQLRIDDNQEILVRGETLFPGYWDPLQQKIISMTRDGWFPTKDLGQIDEQGHLTLLGRKDRMFISGGENIQPEEIEAALCKLPGILAAHVIPMDDVEFGKRPTAYLLEESPQYTLESVRAALAEKLPSFKHPTKIFPYTDAMRNGMKIVKSS